MWTSQPLLCSAVEEGLQCKTKMKTEPKLTLEICQLAKIDDYSNNSHNHPRMTYKVETRAYILSTTEPIHKTVKVQDVKRKY